MPRKTATRNRAGSFFLAQIAPTAYSIQRGLNRTRNMSFRAIERQDILPVTAVRGCQRRCLVLSLDNGGARGFDIFISSFPCTRRYARIYRDCGASYRSCLFDVDEHSGLEGSVC